MSEKSKYNEVKMKKLLFIIMMLCSSSSFALTKAQIDACKARTTREYISRYQYSIWNVDHFETKINTSGQPGYNQALTRCNSGIVYLYKAKSTHNGTGAMIANMHIEDAVIKAGQNGIAYTDIMKLSAEPYADMTSIRHCYQPSYAASNLESDYFTTAASCAPDPNLVFSYQYDEGGTWIRYKQPHLAGYSYPDTALTLPIYSCKGFQEIPFQTTLRTYYFLSFDINCDGKTKLNHVMGYANRLVP